MKHEKINSLYSGILQYVISKASSIIYYICRIRSEEFAARWEAVEKSILETGTYDLTFEELEYGVQLAWRNEPRCTARIQWGNLVNVNLFLSLKKLFRNTNC